MDKMNFIVENQVANIVMGTSIAELEKTKKNAEKLLQTLKNKGANETGNTGTTKNCRWAKQTVR